MYFVFSKVEIIWTYLQGLFWLFAEKNEKKKNKKNTRGQENKESPTQFLVPQDSLNQKLWVGSSMLYFSKSSK